MHPTYSCLDETAAFKKAAVRENKKSHQSYQKFDENQTRQVGPV